MLVDKTKANRNSFKRLIMTEKDIKAISKIINGILYGTRFFNPMAETIGRYLESKGMIQNKVDFKNLCVNGSKSDVNDDTLVVYRPPKEKPEKTVYIDEKGINYSSDSLNRALRDLKESKGKMLKIVTKTYGYKRKNQDNKR
tara:strand:- start:2739 stop:3164 length:426 start_codon:yes stop_codon:yes gene_type:complete